MGPNMMQRKEQIAGIPGTCHLKAQRFQIHVTTFVGSEISDSWEEMFFSKSSERKRGKAPEIMGENGIDGSTCSTFGGNTMVQECI
eukprot:15031994-Ditylum_brightwellii.AAC.1